MFDPPENLDDCGPLYVCINCGCGTDEAIPSPSGYGVVCSDDCRAALRAFLDEAHAERVRVVAVLDYLDRDLPPF
jgi:hypothetical protein